MPSAYQPHSPYDWVRRIYGWKYSFTAMRERSRKTWFPTVYPTIYLPNWKIWIQYPLNLPYAIFPDANTVYTETVTMPTNHTRHMIEVTTNSSACLLYTTHSSFCRKCLTRNHLHERFVYRFLKILFCPQWLSAELSFHHNKLRPSAVKKKSHGNSNNLWASTQDFGTVNPVLNGHWKRRQKIGLPDRLSLNAGQKHSFCNTFNLH